MDRIEAVVDLIEVAGRLAGATVVVVGGDRVEDLRLVEAATDHGVVNRVVLVGSKERIDRAVEEVGIEVSQADVISAEGDEEADGRGARAGVGARSAGARGRSSRAAAAPPPPPGAARRAPRGGRGSRRGRSP